MKRTMYRGLPLLGLLVVLIAPGSMAAVPGFTELPNLTAYLECRATTCTTAQLQQNAKNDAVSRGAGTYQYLLGNVSTGLLTLVQVTYIDEKLCDYGCNKYFRKISIYQQTAPSDYVNQFGSYATYAGEGPIVIHVDPTKGPCCYQNDDAWEFDTSGYVRGLPEFASVFLAQQTIQVEVIFSDGSSAVFITVPGMYNEDPNLAFAYVPGTAKDKDGNPLPDSAFSGLSLTMVNSGQFAGWSGASQNGGFLILPNVPVYYDTDLRVGGVIISTICDSDGNCYTSTP